MTIQKTIESKLAEELDPLHLEVINESSMHNVPEGAESHFKVTAVSTRFEGQNLVSRHRLVNGILAAQLAGPVHALAINTLTPDEWFDKTGRIPDSPPCLGGSKIDTP